MASYRLPESYTTSLLSARSVATAQNGTGSVSMGISGMISLKIPITFSPFTRWSGPMEISASASIRFRSRANARSFTCSSLPAANMPPIRAPIEVPATDAISYPRSCNSSIAPICANPRAPPLDRTKATLFIFIRNRICANIPDGRYRNPKIKNKQIFSYFSARYAVCRKTIRVRRANRHTGQLSVILCFIFNFLLLHLSSGNGTEPWCNGNTADFGSVILGSNPDGSTSSRPCRHMWRQGLFFTAIILYLCGRLKDETRCG